MHLERHWIRQVRAPAPHLGVWAGDGDDVFPSLPAAWQCDLRTDQLRWTDGVFDLFGISRGARIDRRSTLEQYAPESREMLERLRRRAIETCGSFTFEAQIERLSGEMRWMRLTADVQKCNGRAAILYGTKQDITAEMMA